MHWEKLGKVFTPQKIKNRLWLQDFAQGPSTLFFEKFIRVYFSCRPKPNKQKQYVSYSAYVDLDKTNLFKILNLSKKPILQLGATGEFDEFGTYPVSVIKHNNEIRAYYGGWTRCESVPFNVSIGLAISNNKGKTFTKAGAGPILSFSPDEPFILSGPKIRKFNNLWYLWYIAGKKWKNVRGKMEPVYKIRMATSTDGFKWSKINRNIIPNKIEEDEAQASPDVFYKNGKYHMFFCYRYSENYRNKERGYRIGYAYSKDLLKWYRDDSKVGIDISLEGWDSEMISYPHIFELNNKIYMLYLGNDVGRNGFGLAKLNGSLK